MIAHFFFSSKSSVPYGKSDGGITVTVVKKRDSGISLTDESSIPSHEISGSAVETSSPSNTVTSSSVESLNESRTQDQSTIPSVVILPTPPPATVLPLLHETTESTLRACSSYDVV